MKIAFIGLGLMGSRMASNLLKNGKKIIVYNRSREPILKLKKLGADVADSLEEAVNNADVVLSMLSTPEVVRSCFLEEGGALSKMKKNAIWIDCSTVNPSFSVESNQIAEAIGVQFIDAPVAGTLPHAEKAELVFFAGGKEELINKVESILTCMGTKVMRLGETGKGSSFKMLVNIMLAQSMLIFSEAILFGEKMGLSKDFLLNLLPNLVVSAPVTKFKAEMIKEGKYEALFPLELMHKDLHLASVTAYELKQPLYLANLAKEIYAEANKSGMGRMDFGAIHKYLEER